MSCPVCERLSPDRSRVCECGYDFITRDAGTAIVRANLEREEAGAIRSRGIALLVVAPLTACLGVLSVFVSVYLTALILMGILPVQLLAGVAWAAHGGMQSRRARKRLGYADSLRKLPEARLLK